MDASRGVNGVSKDYTVTPSVVGLYGHLIKTLRGKRLYTPDLLGTIANVGTCPPSGGSRDAIASIISHMGGICRA